MKHTQTQKIRRAVLIGISGILIAAISVATTLAYLSTVTNVKDNVFTASGNIVGRVLEPHWETNDGHYVPGRRVSKDPTVDNETSDAKCYAGLKLAFFIDDGSGYQQVDLATMQKFVDFENLTGSGWVAADPNNANDMCKYYLYDNLLDVDADTGTTLGSTANDHTSAIFTAVIPKKDLNIKTTGTAHIGDLTGSTQLKDITFGRFDFKIKVYAHGAKSANADGSGVTVSKSECQGEIMTALKAIAATAN